MRYLPYQLTFFPDFWTIHSSNWGLETPKNTALKVVGFPSMFYRLSLDGFEKSLQVDEKRWTQLEVKELFHILRIHE